MLQLHALRKFANKYQSKLGKWRTRRRQKADEVAFEKMDNIDNIVESN